jgi:peptide/nickel transport system substrate-binding protein
MKVNTLERALYYTRADNNDMTSGLAGTGGLDRCSTARLLRPASQGTRDPWTLWYVSNGKDGQDRRSTRRSA